MTASAQKVALVTGAARGIGLAVAKRFLADGWRVALLDIEAGLLEKSVARLARSDATLAVTCDVSDPNAVASALVRIERHFARLDALINNAGVAGPTGRVEEIAPEEWDRCLAINITGQFNCVRLAVPHLRESRNASIVNLSSAAGRLGFPMRTPYAASKWAVVGFTKSLSAELGPLGIRVNAIQPGSVDGERIRGVFRNKAAAKGISYEDARDAALSVVSLRTLIAPQEVADAIVFMCSPRGRTISGQAVSICGDTQMLP